MLYKMIKRIIDVILSLLGLVILAPLFLILSIWIKLDSHGPILFKQKRLGLHGEIFTMYKFRSMTVGAEKGGVYESKNDPRVTKAGNILRKTSLDEIPQLINVLKGDMSFIGPRPPLTYHPWCFDEYSEKQKNMFNVRPGVTGWAQVNGRKNVEWNKRIELNIYYVENMSFLLDLRIILITFLKVLKNEDNYNAKTTVKDEY